MGKRITYSLIILSCGLFLTACLQTNNSSAGDKGLYSPASAEFQVAKGIFSNSCGGTCHSFHTMSEEDLVAMGLVVAGNFEASPVYYRSIGSSGTGGPKDMPLGISPLTTAQLQAIQTWIQGL